MKKAYDPHDWKEGRRLRRSVLCPNLPAATCLWEAKPNKSDALDRGSVDVIGVPFDAYARNRAVAAAAAALRGHGLLEALSALLDARDLGDLTLPGPVPRRAPRSGLLNEAAVVALTKRLREALSTTYGAGRFPLVVGADCGVLLGCLAGARDHFGTVGLVFVDGHEDAYTLEQSPDGQIADSELALALGLTGATAPGQLRCLRPLVDSDHVAMLGPRRSPGAPTLEGKVFLRRDQDLLRGPVASLAQEAIAIVRGEGRAFWTHTDLDVLCTEDFAAQDFPEPGGIGWAQLEGILLEAVTDSRCIGWSVVIYNPDLDPDGRAGRRIIRLVSTILGRNRG